MYTYIKNHKETVENVRHIMSKQVFENFTLAGHIEGKKGRGRQQVVYLRSLCKWIEDQGVGMKE